MNKISISALVVGSNRIEFDCSPTGKWSEYFTDNKFYVEYETDISEVPKSILIIPILGTILPLSWIFDAEIYCQEIDEDFYNSIVEFKKGYIQNIKVW